MKTKTPKLEPWIADILEDVPKLIPIQDAADLLSVSTRTLRSWAAGGRLRVLKTSRGGSGRVLVPRAELARVLAAMAVRVPFGA